MKHFCVVPYGRLLHKMDAYGISDTILKWVDNFLVGRTHWISVNGHESAGYTSTSDIPHGSVLGPALFLIYINDIFLQSLIPLFSYSLMMLRYLE